MNKDILSVKRGDKRQGESTESSIKSKSNKEVLNSSEDVHEERATFSRLKNASL